MLLQYVSINEYFPSQLESSYVYMYDDFLEVLINGVNILLNAY